MRLRQAGIAYSQGTAPAVPSFAATSSIVVVAHDGALLGLNPDLTDRWRVDSGLRDTPWIEDDATFLVNEIFEQKGPNKIRRHQLSSGAPGLGVDRKLGTFLASGSGILVRRESGSLVGLATDDLSERWTRPWYSEVQLLPSATRFGAVLKGHNGWSIRSVNWREGTDRWTFDIKGRAPAGRDPEWYGVAHGRAIAVSGDRVGTVTTGGVAYVLAAESGEVIHEQGVGNAGSVWASHGGLWIFDGEEAIEFSVEDLRISRRVRVGGIVREILPSGLSAVRGVAARENLLALRTETGLVALRRAGDHWHAAVAEIPGLVPFLEEPIIEDGHIFVLDRAGMAVRVFLVER